MSLQNFMAIYPVLLLTYFNLDQSGGLTSQVTDQHCHCKSHSAERTSKIETAPLLFGTLGNTLILLSTSIPFPFPQENENVNLYNARTTGQSTALLRKIMLLKQIFTRATKWTF